MLCQTALFLSQSWATIGWRPPSNGSVDSTDGSIRCHWEQEEDIDRCQDVLQYAEEAWAAQVDGIGFPAPAADEDGVFDLYLYRESSGGAFTSCSEWWDDTDDGFSACPAYIALANSISDAEMASFVAHEFNHALQYAMDFNEPTLPIWEGVATAAEAWTYPGELYPTVAYIGDYQATPWMGLLGDGYFLWDAYNIWSYYEYGAALWILHLDAVYGDGAGAAGLALWLNSSQEGLPNNPDVIDGYDATTGDWKEALLSLSAARVRVGQDDAPSWSSFTGTASKLAFEAQLDASELPATVTPKIMPYSTGSVYVNITDVPDGYEVLLEVEVPADSAWGVVFSSGDEEGWAQGTSLAGPGPGTVAMGVVNLDHDEYATTGAGSMLVASQRDITLSLSLQEATDEASGDTGADTGAPTTDDTAAPDSPSGQQPLDDGESVSGGCGCQGSGGGGGALSMLVMLAVVGRRRR